MLKRVPKDTSRVKHMLQQRVEEAKQLELVLEERGVKTTKMQIVRAEEAPNAKQQPDVTQKKTLTMKVFDAVVEYMRDEVKTDIAS